MVRTYRSKSENKSRGRRYSQDEKREILSSFRDSGLSLHAFCIRSRFCYTTLRRWVDENERLTPSDSSPREHSFVEVKLDKNSIALSSPMEIMLPGGVEIRVHSQNQVAWAGELVHLCKESSC